MLSELLAEYLSDCGLRGLSPKTIRAYRTYLQRFVAADPDPLDTAACQRYLVAMRARGMRPRTRLAAHCALTQWCAWLVRRGALSANPMAPIPRPRLDPPRRALCTDAEIADALAACNRLPDPRRAALAKALLLVIATTGLRRAEVLSLHKGDVDLTEGALCVRSAKGGVPRRVFAPECCSAALRAWLEVRGRCRHDYLWDYDHSRRIGDAGLRTLLREVAAVAGHRDSAGLLPHALRHAYATRLARAGAGMEDLRAALGHSSCAVTGAYLHTDEDRLRAIRDLAAVEPAPRAPAPAQASTAWSIASSTMPRR